jgi:hypothetical protein
MSKEDVLVNPFELRWVTIIIPKGDGEWGKLRGAQLLPYIFGHDTSRHSLVYNALIDGNVFYCNKDLEDYHRGNFGL